MKLFNITIFVALFCIDINTVWTPSFELQFEPSNSEYDAFLIFRLMFGFYRVYKYTQCKGRLLL